MASLPDFRDYANRTMSQTIFNKLEAAAHDGLSKKLNEEDFFKIKLKLRGMANLKFFKGTETSIFSH